MNIFFGALRLDGRPISKRELFAVLTKLPRTHDWAGCGDGAFYGTALADKHTLRPMIAEYHGLIGIGDVRLDNREEIAAISGIGHEASDLQVVVAAIDRIGSDVVPKLYGDFSFVAWDPHARKIIAARDCFGVKPLFYRRTAEHLLLCSRLEPLAGEEIDHDYARDFVRGLSSVTPRTIWRDVLQVEPGATVVQRGSVTAQSRYWSANSFEPAARCDERTAVEEFRQHFFESIIQRVSPGETWAQLSGGLDSSAVVSTAEWLNESGLATALRGTVTITDQLGTGDERRYSDAVLARYALPNEQVVDYWPWRNDNAQAPAPTDAPSPLYPFFARDNRTVEAVRSAGARILLSGLGADHYMFGSLSYMADMFVRGQFREGARECLNWAVETRRSFWHTAQRNVLRPIAESVRSRSRIGRFYQSATTLQLAGVSNWIQRDAFQDRLEVRYPFLSRRLVEFTLRLPVSMKVRPTAQKWVLREAMRGIVPELVRGRTHKGGIDARILWALQHEHRVVEALVTDPMIAQMGLIETKTLREIVEKARQGATDNTVHVMSALALESWLRARNGAWPMNEVANLTAA